MVIIFCLEGINLPADYATIGMIIFMLVIFYFFIIRPESRKSLYCKSSTAVIDRSWHETHVQNAKSRAAEAGMGNAGA